MQEKKDGGLVRFDATGHFEIVDDGLIAELGPEDAALVTGGATQTDVRCGGTNAICVNGGCFGINELCREGTLDLACHGNHQLDVVC